VDDVTMEFKSEFHTLTKRLEENCIPGRHTLGINFDYGLLLAL